MEKSFGVEETSFTGVHDAPPISAAEAEDIITFLDTGATISTRKDRPIMANMRPAEQPIDMGTNNGVSRLDVEGDDPTAPGGKAYWTPKGIANIDAMCALVDECKRKGDGSYVHMDTRYDDALWRVSPADGNHLRWGRIGGLYGRKIDRATLDYIKSLDSGLQVPSRGFLKSIPQGRF